MVLGQSARKNLYCHFKNQQNQNQNPETAAKVQNQNSPISVQNKKSATSLQNKKPATSIQNKKNQPIAFKI